VNQSIKIIFISESDFIKNSIIATHAVVGKDDYHDDHGGFAAITLARDHPCLETALTAGTPLGFASPPLNDAVYPVFVIVGLIIGPPCLRPVIMDQRLAAPAAWCPEIPVVMPDLTAPVLVTQQHAKQSHSSSSERSELSRRSDQWRRLSRSSRRTTAACAQPVGKPASRNVFHP
jgi:hypothetical protein